MTDTLAQEMSVTGLPPSQTDIAISVRNLTKTYRLFAHPGDRIKQAATLGLRKYHKEFTALKDVSFDIKKGETVGIIGRNGSGKSTLLQLICGILKPTSGTVKVNGRVSALLELGAGFNPEFTGRENVYFQGTLMGFTKAQMDERFGKISAFADIGEFIDQPVRTYSSGMFVRLAFAVASHVEPDILIVDEALNVGDAIFQHKSKKLIQTLKGSGTSLLFVSHDRNVIAALCDSCILLEEGGLTMISAPQEILDYYYAKAAAKYGEQIIRTSSENGKLQTVSGSGDATVEHISLLNSSSQEITDLVSGEPVILRFHVRINNLIPRLVLGFSIRDQFGQLVYGINANSYDKALLNVPVGQRYEYRFSFHANIGVGTYSISTVLVSLNDRFSDNYECRDLAYFFSVHDSGEKPCGGVAWLDPTLEVLQT
jgi:lipopolysaccharide transport system ATP-binding protein